MYIPTFPVDFRGEYESKRERQPFGRALEPVRTNDNGIQVVNVISNEKTSSLYNFLRYDKK